MHVRVRPVLAVALAAGLVTAGVLAATHTNPAPINVSDSPAAGSVGTATPYPSKITVSGEAAVVADVDVTLTGLGGGFSDDLDVLLRSPAGTAVVLMSDAGDGNPVSGLTLKFDDSAGGMLPDEAPPTTGSYRPSNYGKSAAPFCADEPDPDTFPAPAPGPPYLPSLTGFTGTLANGEWRLYVVDDCRGDTAAIVGGWSLTIAGPTAVAVRDLTARVRGSAAELRWRTVSESRIVGFDVGRSGGGAAVKVNRKLIVAKRSGGTGGASYRLVDPRVRRGTSYTYRLEVVRADGSRSRGGIVALHTPR